MQPRLSSDVLSAAAALFQYLAGRGDENAAESFCFTLWLPHFGQTASVVIVSIIGQTREAAPKFPDRMA